MNGKKLYSVVVALALTGALTGLHAQTYLDVDASARERAESIVAEMTLEEKVSLMQNDSPAIPRLGIKAYNWWNEALHGVARAGLATVFPQAVGMAAAFDDELLFDVFRAVSDEARAKNQQAKQKGNIGIYQGLTFWTPNVNIFRDPRWGRGQETYGEDPYLTSRLGTAVVRGLQGDNFEGTLYAGPDAPKYYKAHACAKHFAVHSGPEWNRHFYNAEVSDRDLHETYLPAFKTLVQDAGVKEVMCAYNRFEGQPCCGNSKLLGSILRDDWGYKNLVVSDCWAVSDFYKNHGHRNDYDRPHAAARAVGAGTDVECGVDYASLVDAVHDGLIDEGKIDRSLVRLMTARYELGEMDDDALVSWTQIPYSTVDSKEHRNLAKQIALESVVLLKNEDNVLPLKRKAKIGLIGPNADDSVMQWGNYNGFPSSTSTLLSALQQQCGSNNIIYVPGLDHTSDRLIISAFGDTRNSQGVPGWDAKFWNTLDGSIVDSSEPEVKHVYTAPLNLSSSGATVWAPGVNLGRFVGVFSTKFVPTSDREIAFGTQVQGWMSVSIDGQTVFQGGNMKSPAAYTFTPEAGKEYDIQVYYRASEGDCASLSLDFGVQQPLDVAKLVEPLADADVIVFAGGLTPMLEGEEMPVRVEGFRGGDRDNIELPQVQQRVVRAVAELGKPVVFVNYSGSAVALTPDKVPAQAIVQAWYPGQAGGEAVADVLTGRYNPSGRLPVTFYASSDDLPDFLDYGMYGRTYRYFDGQPLFPFGHGLSYTNFEYGDAEIAHDADGNAVLKFTITNTGKTEGTEVAQLYVSRPDDYLGPKQQLRDFKRVSLKPKQAAEVVFVLDDDTFAWYEAANPGMRAQPGEYVLWYGRNSADTKSLTYTRQ